MSRVLVYVWAICALFLAASQYAQAQLAIQFSKDTINLGAVAPCVGARDSFLLVNIGTRVVPSPGLRIVPGFRVEAANEDNIAPGESRTIYVTFVGNAVVGSYSSLYIVNVTLAGESSTDTMHLIAERKPGPCCVFRIDTVTGRPGDAKAIVLRQDSTQAGVFLSDVVSTFVIDFDETMVVPQQLPACVVARTTRSVTVRTSLLDGNGVLCSIPIRLTLGSLAESTLRIGSRNHSDVRVLDAVYPGAALLDGICIDPKQRFFDATVQLIAARVTEGGIAVAASHESCIVSIIDASGRRVNETTLAAHEEHFVPLPRGLYCVRAREFSRVLLVQ